MRKQRETADVIDKPKEPETTLPADFFQPNEVPADFVDKPTETDVVDKPTKETKAADTKSTTREDPVAKTSTTREEPETELPADFMDVPKVEEEKVVEEDDAEVATTLQELEDLSELEDEKRSRQLQQAWYERRLAPILAKRDGVDVPVPDDGDAPVDVDGGDEQPDLLDIIQKQRHRKKQRRLAVRSHDDTASDDLLDDLFPNSFGGGGT